ncbi:MAG: phosphoesterase [Saprospirales bacterium]|nr:phosphoesterase [Saprospirales bacterium]
MYRIVIPVFCVFILISCKHEVVTLQVPGSGEYCKIDSSGTTVLPSGRFVTPAGKVVRINRAPFGMALSPDEKTALVLHNGVVTLLDLSNGLKATRVPDFGDTIPRILDGSSYLGVAYLPDGNSAWLSGGGTGDVVLFDVVNRQKVKSISLNGAFNGRKYEDSFTSDLIVDPSRNHLLVLDRGNFRLVRIDLATDSILASIPVGRIPFGIALSPDQSTAFVANVGLYEYPLVPGVTPESQDSFMLEFPAYGVPSKDAEDGVTLEDGREIPGLGSPLVPEAMSVWTIDLYKDEVNGKYKTGFQIGDLVEGDEVVGGAHPNSLAVGQDFAYISNASNDLISILDYQKGTIVGEIPLLVHPKLDGHRGVMPFGLALSPDERTLYVACLSLNAVAVVDVESLKVKGYIPTGWMPSRVAVSKDGETLFIVSARGYGAGPNGGADFAAPPQGTYIGDIQLGTFQVVQTPDEVRLEQYTQQVLSNTFREVRITDDRKNPLPPLPALRKTPIQYIIYVTKENRTYDEVLGQLSQGLGDPSLARFGVGVDITIPDHPENNLTGVDVMPNHLKIAREFAFSDNFYCDSDASIHGHKWMVGTIPNEYVETNSQVSAEFKPFSSAPGRRFPRTTGAMDPEDYNEKGGIWENLARDEVSYFNFGEANEYTGPSETWRDTLFGARNSVVFPMPKPLFDRTCRTYPGYNMSVPDQFRMDQFEAEFSRRWLGDQPFEPMPQVITIILPNDHGTGPRPEAGYPYLHSYMADNDLALGRLLHFLSRTPYWKNTLVIITEDDPQGGVDHVDAHRSVLLMAGPYVKRGYVSHTHANFGSLIKVIYNIVGADYLNHYDLTASLLQDFFTDQPDYTPYTLEPADSMVFKPQKALDIYQHTFDWEKILQGPKMDDEKEQRESFYKQH